MPTPSAVAVVTGANKGVGYHIAAQLVASNLFGTVVLACRDPARGLAAAKEVGGDFLPLTVGDPQSAQAFAAAVSENFGRCDVLVNNAAVAFKNSDPTPFEQQTKPTLDVNFRGTLQVTEALLPLLAAAPSPRIVNVASMAGKLKQLSPAMQGQLASPTLTLAMLHQLVGQFETDVARGRLANSGWGRSNYGSERASRVRDRVCAAAQSSPVCSHRSVQARAHCRHQGARARLPDDQVQRHVPRVLRHRYELSPRTAAASRGRTRRGAARHDGRCPDRRLLRERSRVDVVECTSANRSSA
jgi:NAD(P)-dependent dehydrogenase (short-subunit alcohol dehydrogenase family)